MNTPIEPRPLPALWCPFPARISPHADAVHEGTCEWLVRFGLGGASSQERESIAQVAYLAARFHPDASFQILQLISNWYAWFFSQDDECDKSELSCNPTKLTMLHSRLLTILSDAIPNRNDHAIAHALYDLRVCSQQMVSSCWMEQLIAGIGEYFATMVWEANNRQQGLMPSLDTYMRLRPVTGGLPIEQVLAKISCNIILPTHIQHHPYVQHITLLADQVICWVNDLLSFNKELQQGDVHNLVIVLQHEQQLSRAAAVEYVITLHNIAVQHFVTLVEHPSACAHGIDEADDTLQRYVHMLQIRIAGHADWATQALRYQVTAV